MADPPRIVNFCARLCLGLVLIVAAVAKSFDLNQFAQRVGDVNGGKASRAHPGKNGNYAHGGGRGRNNQLHSSPDSLEQAQSMIADFGGAPSDGIYVIQFGGNDIRDAIAAIGANADGSPNLSTSFSILYGASAEVAGSIQALYAAGARHFLVANAPNVANAPGPWKPDIR